jgi:hypothetical protein
MNPILQHLVTNWKTSLQGILSAVIALGVYLAAVPTTVIPQHTAAIIAVIVGAAKVLLGLVQSDAKPSVTTSTTIETTTPIQKEPSK